MHRGRLVVVAAVMAQKHAGGHMHQHAACVTYSTLAMISWGPHVGGTRVLTG
jgi:hypothetical protein